MAYKTICLKGDPLRKEEAAAGTITPGHLIKHTSSGYVVHSTAGGNQSGMFAIENALEGDEIDDNYSSGERVQAIVAYPGCEVYAILATSQTIVIGDYLESAGDGTVRKHTAPTEASNGVLDVATLQYKAIVGRAMEAKTTTGATARIIMECL